MSATRNAIHAKIGKQITTLDDYRVAVAKAMVEDELLAHVIDCAHTYRWLAAHFRPARTEDGWRTAVSADGAGFPDLVLTRDGSIIFAELKSESGRVAPRQALWLRTLQGLTPFADGYGRAFHPAIPGQSGVDVCVWRPSDWVSGRIEECLR